MCPHPLTRKPLLCYVTDRRSLAESPTLARNLQLEKIEQAAKAGVDWVQIREKDLSGRGLAKLTEQAIQRAGSDSSVLVNDRLDVARAAGAAGVHLGGNSLSPSEVRKLVNRGGARANFLIGVSAHSLEGAVQAEQAGADYVIFGPVYTTPSKASFGEPQGVQRLKEICKRLTIPVLAIGGITVENAAECVGAGVAGIAAIRLFQDGQDLDAVVKELRKVS